MPRFRSANSYWMGLSAAYGIVASLLCVAELSQPWLLVIFGALLLFVLAQGMLYGQLARAIAYEVDPKKGTAGAIMTIFPLGTYLIRGSEIALWAGPLYGLAAFAGSFVVLKKHGYFYEPAAVESE